MISLRLLTLVFLTLGCRQWAQASPLPVPGTAGLCALGVALGFGLIFKMAALRLLSTDMVQTAGFEGVCAIRAIASHRCSLTRNRIEAAWIFCLPLALMGTGWGAALVSLREAGLPQAVELLGWFMPSLFLLVLLELSSAQFYSLNYDGMREDSPADSGNCQLEEQANAGQVLSWPREFLLRVRLGDMASLLMCLAPVMLIAVAQDLVRLFADDWLVSQVLIGAMILALGCVISFLPHWLSRWMGASQFPNGELRARIESQLQELKIRGVELRLLRSRGRWPGAAIVGWLPGFRQLWLGDALIERLTGQQVDMVVMHELAHVTRKHFLWRVFPLLWAIVIVFLFGLFWPETEQWKLAGALLSSIVACVVMLAGLSAMAHRCELDADLTACTLAEQTCAWARDNPAQARRELAAALIQLLRDCPQAGSASWLHPSLVQRVRNLARRVEPSAVGGDCADTANAF